jgi:hypothetical protein
MILHNGCNSNVLNAVFSVRPLCSLCLGGECLLAIAHHRGAEDTKDAQRRLQTKTPPNLPMAVEQHIKHMCESGGTDRLRLR